MKASLSDTVAARAAKPVGAPNYIIWDSRVPGFGLRVGAESSVWVVSYRNAGGKQRKMRLGVFPTLGTDKARKLAKGIVGDVAGGTDPAQDRLEQRRKERARLETLLDQYLVERTARGLVAAQQEDNALRTGFGEKLLNTDVATIDRKQMARLLDSIKGERGPGAAGYFRKSARTFFDWCVNGGATIANPLAGYRVPKRTRAEKLAEEEKGRALPSSELARVWIAADDVTVFGRLVRFIVLTGCRRDEAASLQRDWVDQKAGIVTLPAWLTKMGRDHIIAITPALAAVLDKCPETRSPFVFPASRIGRRRPKASELRQVGKIKGWSKLMRASGPKAPPKLVERSGVDFTLHDLRRSLKTHVRELGFDSDVAGLLVGHARDSFEARYDKSELLEIRRKASEAYAGMIAEAVRAETTRDLAALSS